MKKLIKYLLILILLGGASYGVWRWKGKSDDGPTYRTAKVERGDLQQKIAATGNISPLVSVQVGSQVSGILKKIYVDFNSRVKQGQLIAELDTTLFEAAVNQAEGDYLTAKANAARAELALKRAQDLFDKKIGPQIDLDNAKAEYDAALGALKRAEGSLMRAKADLANTKIHSPIDGIVTSRAVDVGQTVAASLSAPTLFIIANDLTRMQINTFVDQADIGLVHDQQKATFNVDAYPHDTFTGMVVQVRNNPTNVQNVITYDVIVSVNNDDLKLKPGMTANVYLLAAEARDAIKMPNAALRFRPLNVESEQGKPSQGEGRREGRGERGKPKPNGLSGTVWALGADGKPDRRTVELGLSDGQFTEVKSGLKEAEEVITGYLTLPNSGSSSPFGGPMGGRRRF